MIDDEKINRIAFAAVALIAAILSLYSALIIFNVWFLVPADASKTPSQDLEMRLAFTVGAVVAFAVLILIARWALRKRKYYSSSN
jgi:hypothetical protein